MNRLGLMFVAALVGAAGCGMSSGDGSQDPATDDHQAAITLPGDTLPIDPPPSDLSVESVTSDEVDLLFNCGANATNHKVYRDVDGGPAVAIATMAACQVLAPHSYVDDNPEPGRHNCYRIGATNSEHSAQSGKVCVDIPPDLRPPAAPTNGTVTDIGTFHAILGFTDASDNEGGFRTYLSEADGPWNLVDTTVRATRSDHATGQRIELLFSTFRQDTKYQFKIEAYHDFAPLSTEVVLPSFRTIPDAPSTPTNLHVTGFSNHSISIGWGFSANADHYNIVQTQGTGNNTYQVDRNSTSFTQNTLLPDVSYCYKVVAVNSGGTEETPVICQTTAGASSQSFDLILRLNPSDLYQSPFGPIRNGTLTSLELRDAPNHGTITAFDLVPETKTVSSACDDTSVRVRVNIGGSVTGADLAKLYGSTAPSLNGPLLIHGCTVPRAAALAFITAHYTSPAAAAAPTAPGSVQIPASASRDSFLTVSWANSTGEDAYVIEQVGGTADVPMAWATAGSTSITMGPLHALTQYCFRVTAFNSAGMTASPTLACGTTSDLETE